MSIEQKVCEVNIFQLQSMSNAIRCIDQRFAFKNSRISCLALIFNLNIRVRQSWTQKNRFQMANYDESYAVFFNQSIRTNGLVVKVSSSEFGDLGSIPEGSAETLCRASAILHSTEPVSALTRVLFILLRSL